MPDAMHSHVRPQDDISGKPDEQVLAACLHPFESFGRVSSGRHQRA
jgi:hypothetical protein